MNNVKVSVIMPVHNAAKYLHTCMNSLVNQTLKDIEIICINDDSTDNSLEILEQYKRNDPRIKIFNVNCHCPGGARNKGLDTASGEFVGFIDADDWIDHDYFEKLYSLAVNSSADIAATSSVKIIRDNKFWFDKNMGATSLKNPLDSLVKKANCITVTGSCCNKIFKASMLKKYAVRFLEIKNPSEDNYFNACAVIAANKLMFLDNSSYYYNYVTSSETKKKKTKNDFQMTSVYKQLIEKINTFNMGADSTEDWIGVIEKCIANDVATYCSEMDEGLKKEFLTHAEKEFPNIKKYLPEKSKKISNGWKLLTCTESENGKHMVYSFMGIKLKIRRKPNNSDKQKYLNYVLNHQLDKSDFVPKTDDKHVFQNNMPKLLAFYLPQFHDFEENVKWFGPGFSEWSNAAKAVPQYIGHYQPHIPIDVGFYNLESPSVMKRQIELAKQYGIYGFCFYYYWFSGQKVMEKPLENFLNDKSFDMPFFLFWANEDWTMRWDNGNEKEVLHKQEMHDNDAQKFMHDCLPYMKDSRYIKIDNKPLLVIYELTRYPYEKYLQFVEEIRKIAVENGFDGLYLLSTIKNDVDIYNLKAVTDTYKLNGMLEFFPQGVLPFMEPAYKKIMNPQFKGNIWDVKKFLGEKQYFYPNNANIFKGCFTHWDNTARKCYNYADIYETTPQDYKKWLIDIINWTKKNKPQNEQFVFINAWNEWAEGAHLEPDQKYGYAYLQATKEALEEAAKTNEYRLK